jgi:hypothetical protein
MKHIVIAKKTAFCLVLVHSSTLMVLGGGWTVIIIHVVCGTPTTICKVTNMTVTTVSVSAGYSGMNKSMAITATTPTRILDRKP